MSSPRALLLDIEGTTTPMEFVYDVLFPFARQRLEGFLRAHHAAPELKGDFELLLAEWQGDLESGLAPPSWEGGSPVRYLLWLMDRDRKSTALKAIQGRIWKDGYEAGELRSQVYPDVPRAFERWRSEGRRIAIFSSGSVLAQKLLFRYSAAGDLTPFIDAFFDTAMGSKIDPESYRTIAKALDHEPLEVSFISDAVHELDAAKEAGLRTLLCVRPGRPRPPAAHETIGSFDDVIF